VEQHPASHVMPAISQVHAATRATSIFAVCVKAGWIGEVAAPTPASR
jgi:hypothetical protein